MNKFTPEQIDDLRSLLSAEVSEDIYANLLKLEIENIGEKRSHEAFVEICKLAALAYPSGELSDSVIVTNRATPVLMNYLLDALRSYMGQLKTEEGPTSTAQRREFLQLAFGASGTHGGNTRNKGWDRDEQIELVNSFSKRLSEFGTSGTPMLEVWLKSFMATYDDKFGSDLKRGREPSQIKTNRSRLLRLINEHFPMSTFYE